MAVARNPPDGNYFDFRSASVEESHRTLRSVFPGQPAGASTG
jgi:hypothetical protein